MKGNLKEIYRKMVKCARKGNSLIILDDLDLYTVLYLEERGFCLVKQGYSATLGRANYSISWEKPERPYCDASKMLQLTVDALYMQLQDLKLQFADLKATTFELIYSFPVVERDKVSNYLKI